MCECKLLQYRKWIWRCVISYHIDKANETRLPWLAVKRLDDVMWNLPGEGGWVKSASTRTSANCQWPRDRRKDRDSFVYTSWTGHRLGVCVDWSRPIVRVINESVRRWRIELWVAPARRVLTIQWIHSSIVQTRALCVLLHYITLHVNFSKWSK